MKKRIKSLIISLVIGFSLVATPVFAVKNNLNGTVWVYEHPNGAKHYIGFWFNFLFQKSVRTDEDVDSTWLPSSLPCLFSINAEGSIKYSTFYKSSSAWAFTSGICNLQNEEASFTAFGMIYGMIIYNQNEPYILSITNWNPYK